MQVTSKVFANSESELSKKVMIRNIHFTGNKLTKPSIIQREMNISIGDSILVDEVEMMLEYNKRRILNIQLFSRVEYCIENWDSSGIDIEYAVNEIFFWIPVPIFSLADRNFNVWWVDKNHKLNRTNIGLELSRLNFRGRNETIVASVQLGYNKNFNFSYRIPYLDKKLRHGIYAGVSYMTGREINHITLQNKQYFFSSDHYPYQYFQARVATTYRKGYAALHELRLSYNKYAITSALYDANPQFLGGRTKFNYFELKYDFRFNNTDTRIYPTNGLDAGFFISQKGLGLDKDINQTWLYADASYYKGLGKYFSAAFVARGRLAFGNTTQPYIFQKAMGYKNDYVRGYEYYVIDGTHYGLFRSNLRFKLIDRVIHQNIVKLMKYIPARIYAKAYDDIGYAYGNKSIKSKMNNKLLHGYGVGLDVVLSYYFKFRIEYSFNNLNQNGLFLHGTNE